MSISVKHRILSPPTDQTDPSSCFPHERDITVVNINVIREPSFYEYKTMIESAYKQIEPYLNKLLSSDFQVYIFMMGGSLTKEWMEKRPAYNLYSAYAKQGGEFVRAIERDIWDSDRRRRIGLYQLSKTDILNACVYQSQNEKCLIILSRDRNFLIDEKLLCIYQLNGMDDLSKIGAPIRWHSIATDLCRKGHVVIREMGMFDDLYRSLNVVMLTSLWNETT